MAKPQRAFALVAALLLLASSLAVSGMVIWQMVNNEPATTADSEFVQQQLKEAQQRAQNQNNQGETGMLKGTKLADYTPVSGVTELKIIDIKEGTGEAVPAGGTVTAHYTGALAKDGTIFESSKDSGNPATFPLDGVIKGWQDGVPGMKVGGTRRLIIPSAMAYGEAGSPPNIGPNEPLVFDIELVKLGQ